jgi:prepilin-type N-terminal cleavage/methylation domain-containing protein
MHKFVVTERLSKKRGEFRRGFTLLELVVVVKILGGGLGGGGTENV